MAEASLSLQPKTSGRDALVRRLAVLRGGWALLVWPAFAYLLLVYVVPAVFILRESILLPQFGLQNFSRALLSPGYSAVGLRTLSTALGATTLTLLIAYPIAYFMSTTRGFTQRLLIIAVISPYLTSSLVRTFAWEVLLSKFGLVTRALELFRVSPAELLFTQTAVIIGLVQVLLPAMVLILFSVMRGIDQRTIRAARSLGASPARSFFRVFLPLSVPGIEAGCILTFVFAIGSFIIPAILGGQKGTMYGVIIEVAIDQFADWGFASATALVLALAVVAALIAYRRLMAGNVEWLANPEHVGTVSRSRGHRPKLGLLRSLGDSIATFIDWTTITRHRWPLAAFSIVTAAFLVLPQSISVPISLASTRALVFPPVGLSLQWYANFMNPNWLGPTATSIGVAAMTAVAATLLGGLAAVGVVRGVHSRIAGPLTVFFILPLLVPSIVSVVGIYIVFLYAHLTDTIQGFVLADTALGIPGAFIVLSASIRALDPAFERAASSLGARRWTVLRRIVLPLIRPAVMVSLFFTFLASFDEVVVAVFLSGFRVTTLPARMYEAIQFDQDPTIGVVATLSILVSVVVLFGSARFRGLAVARELS